MATEASDLGPYCLLWLVFLNTLGKYGLYAYALMIFSVTNLAALLGSLSLCLILAQLKFTDDE